MSKEVKAQAAPVKHIAPIAAIRIHEPGLPSSSMPIDRQDPSAHPSDRPPAAFCALTISLSSLCGGIESGALAVLLASKLRAFVDLVLYIQRGGFEIQIRSGCRGRQNRRPSVSSSSVLCVALSRMLAGCWLFVLHLDRSKQGF